MTTALVVAVVVALVCAVGWEQERRRAKELKHWADHFLGQRNKESQRADAAEYAAQAAGEALSKVWHHVTPETPEEAAAASMLRAYCPGLPVPERPPAEEDVSCGTLLGPPWPQCECLRFNPPGSRVCGWCGSTPPKQRTRKNEVKS